MLLTDLLLSCLLDFFVLLPSFFGSLVLLLFSGLLDFLLRGFLFLGGGLLEGKLIVTVWSGEEREGGREGVKYIPIV